jgi:putative membrane protein
LPRFLTEATDKALHDAIASIEAASSAEIEIAVRARARRIAAPAIVIGIAMGATMLALGTGLAPWLVVALPLGVGALGAMLAHTGPIERLLVPPRARRADVRAAARATFYARSVHGTTRRTGVLVFIALHERIVELVADTAALVAIGQVTLDAWGDKLAAKLASGTETAAALAALAPDFAAKLPNQAGETNELGDDVVAVPPA